MKAIKQIHKDTMTHVKEPLSDIWDTLGSKIIMSVNGYHIFGTFTDKVYHFMCACIVFNIKGMRRD